jgi:hypothetical protein
MGTSWHGLKTVSFPFQLMANFHLFSIFLSFSHFVICLLSISVFVHFTSTFATFTFCHVCRLSFSHFFFILPLSTSISPFLFNLCPFHLCHFAFFTFCHFHLLRLLSSTMSTGKMGKCQTANVSEIWQDYLHSIPSPNRGGCSSLI